VKQSSRSVLKMGTFVPCSTAAAGYSPTANRRSRRSLFLPAFCFAFGLLAFAARPAHAYTWMIRHGFSGCAACHLDPLKKNTLFMKTAPVTWY